MAATEPTAEALAVRLEEAGLTELAARARANEFHDYRSPHVLPEHVLEAELKRAGHLKLARAVRRGEFDASAEEAKAWAASLDGQETLRELGGVTADLMGLPPDAPERQEVRDAGGEA